MNQPVMCYVGQLICFSVFYIGNMLFVIVCCARAAPQLSLSQTGFRAWVFQNVGVSERGCFISALVRRDKGGRALVSSYDNQEMR